MRPALPAFTPGPAPALTVPAGSAYNPPDPALRAVFATQAAGIPLLPRDLPPDLVAHIPQCWAQLQAAQQPVTEGHVAAWLKKLAHLVTNPPGPSAAAAQCRAIFDVCEDIPAGAWGKPARLAWVRQPPRQGYPVGARWPSPNELRTILLPFANTIWRDAAACQKLMTRLHISSAFQQRS